MSLGWEIISKTKEVAQVKCKQCGFETKRSIKHAYDSPCQNCKKNDAVRKLALVLKIRGYKLDKDSYTQARAEVRMTCPQGHTIRVRADNALRGKFSCAKCKQD